MVGQGLRHAVLIPVIGIVTGVLAIMVGFFWESLVPTGCNAAHVMQAFSLGGIVVSFSSAMGLAYSLRRQSILALGAVLVGAAVVVLAIALAGFVFGLCGSFL
jgi:hypothetical protein